MKLVHLGIVIVEARGRVTPGLCFELRLSPGGRYAINLGHQLEAVHKSNCRRVSTRLNHDLHAIDATPARWRAPGGLSPLDSVSTVAFSPWKDLVHPTHWLIYAQVVIVGGEKHHRVAWGQSVPFSTAWPWGSRTGRFGPRCARLTG